MSEDTRRQQEERLEACCQRMEGLVKRLPEMEKKNTVWKRMHLAEKCLQAGEEYERLASEMAFQEEQKKHYQEAGKRGLSAYIEAQIGYRQGPVAEIRQTYERLLAESGFKSIDEAREWLVLCGEDKEALKQEIEAFQDEYNRTLAECQRLDEELYGANT